MQIDFFFKLADIWSNIFAGPSQAYNCQLLWYILFILYAKLVKYIVNYILNILSAFTIAGAEICTSVLSVIVKWISQWKMQAFHVYCWIARSIPPTWRQLFLVHS